MQTNKQMCTTVCPLRLSMKPLSSVAEMYQSLQVPGFFCVNFSLNSSLKNIYEFLVKKKKNFLYASYAYTVYRLHTFEGNCPVYNYKFGPNIQATYFNCSSFTSGCPAQMFHSKNVFNCKYVHVCWLVYQK